MVVLCVDPDATARGRTRDALTDAGFEVRTCASVGGARDVLIEEDVRAVVTEHEFDDGTGLELVNYARDIVADVTCVLLTDAEAGSVDTGALSDAAVEHVDKRDPEAYATIVDIVEFSVDLDHGRPYPLPDDEDARLSALERYAADTDDVEASLDRLTRVAKELFDVDTATVGFVEAHRELFVACRGADLDELEREDTICTYTILNDGTTVVDDTEEDPRFRDNAAVAGENIRFYAGAPLVTPEGEAIGVFCLHDGEPRSFPERDRELLAALADETMERLRLHERLRATEGAA